ncbi:MAG: hypothetical protein ISS10_02975 [Candidatus Marinimicrobia bacterium]|nr:hypothetical protein [Candidatus Neomarinimicrobiota bacterium]MBL7059944.1 hypothetical protein [Candidatus Neomarinimicrobiota bacterium]
MKNIPIIILFSYASILSGQPFLNRVLTPIYVTSSVMFGYDSNVLKLSESEMDDAGVNKDILGGMQTFDSGIIRPEMQIEYIPELIRNHETRLVLNASHAVYSHSRDKSYSSWSVKMETHLGHYSWLKLGYSLQPNIYLRPYIDRDKIDLTARSCTFANETIWSSVSFPLFDKTWFTGKVKQVHQYFDESFTEFDTEKRCAEGRLTTKILNPFRLSLSGGIAHGQNTTHNSGYISTSFDRSYNEKSMAGSLAYLPKKWIYSVGNSLELTQRFYTSEIIDDPVHAGREQEEIQYRLWIKMKLQDRIFLELNGKYRERQTYSEYEWVEEFKSYSKIDFWITISTNTSLDLFY